MYDQYGFYFKTFIFPFLVAVVPSSLPWRISLEIADYSYTAIPRRIYELLMGSGSNLSSLLDVHRRLKLIILNPVSLSTKATGSLGARLKLHDNYSVGYRFHLWSLRNRSRIKARSINTFVEFISGGLWKRVIKSTEFSVRRTGNKLPRWIFLFQVRLVWKPWKEYACEGTGVGFGMRREISRLFVILKLYFVLMNIRSRRTTTDAPTSRVWYLKSSG